MSHIVSRIFERFSDAQVAATSIEKMGIRPQDISIIAHEMHPDVDLVTETRADPFMPPKPAMTGAYAQAQNLAAIPSLGPLVASGWVTGPNGGLVDALRAAGHSSADAGGYSTAIREGSVLVTVKADRENESTVRAELDSHGSREGEAD